VHSIAQIDKKMRLEAQEPCSDIAGVHSRDAEWLTVEEAAAYLKVQSRTLLLWVRQKKVQGYALSGIKRRVWRFRKADLDAMLFAQAGRMLCSTPPSVLVTKGEKE